ncbi:hypothetical protein [Nocardia fluminea]|uniref:hypothetical protein n=1 Tax=Nocardia fluminea TaxID=134984 RepID=UPI0036473E6D
MSTQDLLAPVRAWLRAGAESGGPGAPLEAVLSTVDAAGKADAHWIRLSRVDHGVVFGASHGSDLGLDLALESAAVLCVHAPRGPQRARIACVATRLDPLDSDRLFDELDRHAQLRTWLPGRDNPEADTLAVVRFRFNGQLIPRPHAWGGYRLLPTAVELGTAIPLH